MLLWMTCQSQHLAREAASEDKTHRIDAKTWNETVVEQTDTRLSSKREQA